MHLNVVKIHVLLYLFAFAQFLVCAPFAKVASTHENDVEPLNFDNFTLPLFKRQEGKKKYEVHLLLLIDNVKKEDEEKEREKAIKFISNINSIMRKTGLTIPLIQFKAAHVDFVDHSLMNEGGKLDGPFNNWKREFAKVKKPEYHAGVQLIHSRGGGVIGWAGVDVLCSGMASASVSGYQPDTNGVYKTTFIHEVFHILGVNHDEDLGCRGSIMAAANSGSRKVSSCTNNVLEKTMPKFASRKNCIQLVDDDGTDDGSADADGDKFDTDSNDYNFDNTPVDEGGRYTVRYEHGYNYNHEENEWVPEPSTSSSSEALETSTTSTSIDPETSTTIASSAENGALVSTLSNTELNPSITTINISPTTSSENPDPKKETVPIQGPSLTTTGTSIEATTTVPILTTTTFSPTPPPIQETSATSVIEEISKNNFSTKEPELHEISSDESEKGTVPIQDPSLTTSVTSIEATTTDPTLTTTTFSSTAPPIQEASSTSVIEQISKNESSTKVLDFQETGSNESEKGKENMDTMTEHDGKPKEVTVPIQGPSHTTSSTSIEATTTDPTLTTTTFSSTAPPIQATSSTSVIEQISKNESSTKVPELDVRGPPELNEEKKDTNGMTKHEIPSEGMTASNQDLSHSATGTSIKATTTDPIKVSTTFSSTTSPMQVTSSEVAPEDLYNPGYAYPGNPHLKDNKDPGTSDSGKGKMDADSLTKQKKDSEKVTSSKEGSSLLPPISPTQETLTKADKGNNAAFELKDDFALQNLDTPSNNNPLFSPTKGKSPEIHSDLNDLDALLFSDEDFSKGPSGNRKGRALNGFKKGAPPADSTSITSGISSASHSVKPIISGKPTIPPSILSTLTSSSTVLSTIIPSQPSDPRNSNKGSTKAIKTSVSLSSTVLSTIIPSQPSDPRNSNKGSTKVIKNSVSLSSTVLPTIFPSRTSDPRILNKDSTKVIKNSITSSYSRQPLKPGITEAPVVRTDLEQSYTPKTPTVRKNSNKQEKKNIKPNNSVPLNDPSNRHVALLPASGASSPEKDRKEKFSPSSSFSSNQPRPVVQDQKNKMPDQKPLKQRGPLNSFNSGPTTPMVKNNKNGIGSTQPPSNNRSNSFGSGGITPIVKNNSNRISSGPPPPPPNKKVAGANASHI